MNVSTVQSELSCVWGEHNLRAAMDYIFLRWEVTVKRNQGQGRIGKLLFHLYNQLHCVPKKWRQNSNHRNYGISYHN